MMGCKQRSNQSNMDFKRPYGFFIGDTPCEQR